MRDKNAAQATRRQPKVELGWGRTTRLILFFFLMVLRWGKATIKVALYVHGDFRRAPACEEVVIIARGANYIALIPSRKGIMHQSKTFSSAGCPAWFPVSDNGQKRPTSELAGLGSCWGKLNGRAKLERERQHLER